MNLREWAEAQHIHPQTAYRWFREGKLPVPAQRGGGLAYRAARAIEAVTVEVRAGGGSNG